MHTNITNLAERLQDAKRFIARTNAHVVSFSRKQMCDANISWDYISGWNITLFSNPSAALVVSSEVALAIIAEIQHAE